mgnify:CR=1 FL=1
MRYHSEKQTRLVIVLGLQVVHLLAHRLQLVPQVVSLDGDFFAHDGQLPHLFVLLKKLVSGCVQLCLPLIDLAHVVARFERIFLRQLVLVLAKASDFLVQPIDGELFLLALGLLPI